MSDKMRASLYNLGLALSASIGTFLFGFDTGIITTTIAHESWIEYMRHPSTAVTGAVVAVYIAGEALGALLQILIADKLGRTRFMQLACIIVTIGVIIQTASVDIGMLLAGRAIAGSAVGMLSATVPIYLSEISAPKTRGLIAGFSGIGIAFGTCISNWVGFAGSYAPYGPVQWRLPLGLQLPWGIILFICLTTYMPKSPRELVQKGRIEEARREFTKIRDDIPPHELAQEFALMKNQIEFEKSRELGFRDIFRFYRHRALVTIGVQAMTSLTGVNVIQYYPASLFKSLGEGPKQILALAGAYGTVALVTNVITVVFLMDSWGRRKMMLTGMGAIVLTEIYAAVLQHVFQNTDNRVGKGFGILGIYLFAFFYYGMLNSTTWLYGSEVVPYEIRSKTMGMSAVAHYVVNVAVTEAGPTAFARIQQNYYYVFVGCTSVFFVLIYFYFPETKQKSLEEIAAAFGDRVVELDETEIVAEGKGFAANAESSHGEDA
ncbi:putative MFS monosaccharide transporter [Xylariaceae sp. FL0255]|nr:putative MFS monosaccharide transporter [Xylariaceae sp. FL0255]